VLFPNESSTSKQNSLSEYEAWLHKHFPHVASKPLADHHKAAWDWAHALKPEVRPYSFILVLARGGGKSTTVELICAYIGQKLSRKYVLYVSGTQDQADKHVQAIATLLERIGIERSLNVYGHSKGWRRNQLRASNGFNVEALGLDTAARGIKLDEFRPGLIIFDDIDSQDDTPEKTAKKQRAITSAIIPAGSPDCAVLGVQNLILDGGIFSQLYEGTADFLLRRLPTVFAPAIKDLEYERHFNEELELYQYRITDGVPTWSGQDLVICEDQMNDWGLASFLREAQHEVKGADGYFFDTSVWDQQCNRILDELPDQTGMLFCRAWDFAATQGGGDFTAGPLHGWKNGKEYVADCKRGQLSSDNVRKLVYDTAVEDREKYGHVLIHIPQDPGQAGKDQAQQYREMLRGFTVKIEPVSGKKAVRARGWAKQVNEGNAYLIKGEWNHHYKEEHRKFREDEEHEHDDQVDPSADAHNELCPTTRPFTFL
jgi:predicted phage terminase large subunit-like protein